jgi:hypothetical protein
VVDPLRLVEVTGLAVGQAVQLQTGDGAAIATATSAASGIATISHLASGAAGGLIPGLVRIDFAGPGVGVGITIGANANPIREALPTDTRGVHVNYIECIPWATLLRGTPYSWLAIGGWKGDKVVAALAGDGLDVFSLHNPARPLLVRTISVPDAVGHLLTDDQLLIWGRRGLWRYTAKDTSERVLDDEPVQGVVAMGEIFAVLHRHRLDVRSVRDGSHIGKYEVDDAEGIASTSRTIVLKTSHGLEILAPVGRTRFGLIAVNEITGIQKLFENNAIRPRTAICVEDGCDVWSVIDLAEPLRPRRVAQYNSRPWFIGARLSGRLIARILDDGALSLSTIGRSVRSWPNT